MPVMKKAGWFQCMLLVGLVLCLPSRADTTGTQAPLREAAPADRAREDNLKKQIAQDRDEIARAEKEESTARAAYGTEENKARDLLAASAG